MRVSGRPPGWRLSARLHVSPFARFGNVLLATGHPGFGLEPAFSGNPAGRKLRTRRLGHPAALVGTGIGHALALVGDRLDGFRRRHGVASGDRRGFDALLTRGKPSRATLGGSNVANAMR